MGNSPSAAPSSAPASSASASSAPASSAPAVPAVPNAPAALLSTNSKKNDTKTVIQVPAESVTVSKGGKRRRFRGGVASVQFDLEPRLQLSDAIMEQVTSAPALSGGKRRRSHKRKTHKRKAHKRKLHRRKTSRK